MFPPAEYVRLTRADPTCLDFDALSLHMTEIRRRLCESEHLQRDVRIVLVLTRLDVAVGADISARKSDLKKQLKRATSAANTARTSEKKAQADAEIAAVNAAIGACTTMQYTQPLNEAHAFLLIEHSIDVVVLPKDEEVAGYVFCSMFFLPFLVCDGLFGCLSIYYYPPACIL
jgi:hypothetical protein